ncbi:MAG: VCBS repeat-containing protein [Candidatus Omnitrophica bacterium]|nr:VCBS repeat-containing protein [Candidatus Omnitrophota bacterium]
MKPTFKILSFNSVVLTAAVLLTTGPSYALTKTLPDLVVTNYQDDSLSTIINAVGKEFVRPLPDLATGDNPLFVGKGDFNNDRIQDVVVVNEAGTLKFLLGRGNGVFEPLTNLFNLGYMLSDTIAVTDFNNDGNADILISSQGTSVQVLLGDGKLAGDPATHFTAQAPVPFAGRSNAVAVADFSRDGNMDAIVCDYNNRKVFILFGNGQGGLVPVQSLNAPTNTQDVSVGDFNADGLPDIAAAGGLDNYVSVYLGQPLGFFTQAAEIKVVTRASATLGTNAVAIADMNNDGYDDLVTLGGSAPNSGDVVDVRLWKASVNSFVAGGTVPAQGAWLAGLNIADLNGDGKNDVIFTNQPSSFAVVVHFGDGNGNLGPRKEFSAGRDPNAIAIIDADPVLNDLTTRVRFSNKIGTSGDVTSFKKKDTLTVTLEDIRLSKSTKPLLATLRLRQGLLVKQVNFTAKPDGTFAAIVKMDGFSAGAVSAVVDFVVVQSGTTLIPDFAFHRKADLTIVP